MKTTIRLLGILVVAAVSGVFFAGVALANEGPHGAYGPFSLSGANTDKCATCHRAHTAQNTGLLVDASITDLCEACHGPGGMGADTDVWNGRFLAGRAPLYEAGYLAANSGESWLNGGGFLSAYNLNSGTFATVTSRHDVAGIAGSSGIGTAFGGGPPAAGYTGVVGTLACTSCHDPHGSRNYRILNAGSSGNHSQFWSADAGMFQNGNVLSNEVAPSSSPGGRAHVYAAGLDVAYDRGISDFCATCHTNYVRTVANFGGQQYDAGDGKGFVPRFRHAVSNKAGWDPVAYTWDPSLAYYLDNSDIPVTDPGRLRRVGPDGARATGFNNGTYVTCLSCHFAHGSAAAATGYAEQVAPTNSSALLFLDNRGVCQQCHRLGQ